MKIFTQQTVSPELVATAVGWPTIAREVEGEVAARLVRDARRAGWNGSFAPIRLSWWVEQRDRTGRGPAEYETHAWDPQRHYRAAIPERAHAFLCRAEMSI